MTTTNNERFFTEKRAYLASVGYDEKQIEWFISEYLKRMENQTTFDFCEPKL